MCDDGSMVCDESECPTSGGGVSGGCDLSTNQVFLSSFGDVYYNIDTDIGGFQWEVDGATVSGASGGAAQDAGFTVSAGGSTVLGFSFTGAVVPAGCGTLTSLSLDGDATGLSSMVFSDSGANAISVSYCSTCSEGSSDVSGCMDDTACNFNPDATLDDGSCIFSEQNFDCDGNCLVDLDCAGTCGGLSVLDDCDDCWTPYCYYGMGSFEYQSEEECAVNGGSWIGPNNDSDPFWNSALDECGVCDGSGASITCDDGSMVCDESECVVVGDSYFNVDIEETGESTLFIFQDTITTLDSGDEVGVYDMSGIVDDTGATGMILVGAGIWTGTQLEVTAISSVNLSEFGGPILPGSVSGNDMMLKVWDASEMMMYDATYTTSSGSGTFNGLFTAVDSIALVEPDPPYFNVGIEETGESTLFIFQDTIEGLEVGDGLGLFDMMGVIDDTGSTGEILVGAGIWTGSQIEVVAISAVDLSEFGGPILPGSVSGNDMVLRVWKASEEMEYEVSYGTSSGSGTFNGLFTAINSISFTPPCADNDDLVAPFTCATVPLGCDQFWGDILVSDACPETCGTCAVYGCTDIDACNYNAEATEDDGSCSYPDEMMGECDCDGTMFDECGVCGGNGPSFECILADGSVELVCDADACDILDSSISTPESFRLSQNYPNPFNPVTTIDFDVTAGGSFIEIKVYDILGNYVKTLTSSYYTGGSYEIKWNGTSSANVEVPSGVYIYQLTHDIGMITKKMILLR